ncbi:MAG: DUF4186 family protein [Pseudonocardiaceae bacterium]|nr:DUF4186 family protein [Pseudonocardiaceae bacterium]
MALRSFGAPALRHSVTRSPQGTVCHQGSALRTRSRYSPSRPASSASGGSVVKGEIDARLDRISRHPFRAKFQLRGRDRAQTQLRSMSTLRMHARDLIFKRLAPAAPSAL